MHAGYRNPLDQGISYEDMYMTTLDGVTIHGWLLKSPNFDEVREPCVYRPESKNAFKRMCALCRIAIVRNLYVSTLLSKTACVRF